MKVKTVRASSNQSSHVRFAADQYQQIAQDSINSGKSIPQLLKEKYFSGPQIVPLLSKPDLALLRTELSRIGNNLNQIAKRINSGVRAGFYDEVALLQASVDKVWLFLSSRYCRCSSR